MNSLIMPQIEPVRDAGIGFGLWPWADGPLFRLRPPWSFRVENGGFEADYVIPGGYEFDKASIPPLLWGFPLNYTPDGLCTVPALEHDFLCDLLAGGSDWLREQLPAMPPTPPADVIHRHFYLRLLEWGVRPSKAAAFHEAVRNFGPGGRLRPSSWFR